MTTHVIFSGGLDSTVALTQAIVRNEPRSVQALAFDYGQRHSRELQAAEAIARRLNVPMRRISLKGLLSSRSLLATSTESVPVGTYNEENLGSTEVQGRNLLFAALAIAATQRGDSVTLGVHGGDHALYPDCRPDFWQHLSNLANAYGVTVRTPFIDMHKSDIVALGAELGAPLADTYSCYAGGVNHCGKCATCRERREAFELAGVADPTIYALRGTNAS